MTMDVIVALIGCGVVAAGLLISVGLFIGIKLHVRRVERKIEKDHAEWRIGLEELRTHVASLAERRQNEEAAVAVAATAGGSPTLNVSKRNHALRLHRIGQTAEQIAEALSIPKNEVQLLLKVHRIVLENF
jgi:hypothetical protein